MNWLFYISGLIAIFSTFMVITRQNAVHALLYLIVSLFSVAVIFFSMGATFAAMLEIIVYAGAIMVLFVFVIMLINPGARGTDQENMGIAAKDWAIPVFLVGILFIELLAALIFMPKSVVGAVDIYPKLVSQSLFGPYVLAVELASILLLAGLVGAYHLGRKKTDHGDKI
jgi:NADH-quinone oxidoreductase subunit J